MSPILPLFLSLMLVQPATDVVEPAADAPVVAVPVENEYPVPPGAPSDDYGLVAWCYGALAGHMQLYDKVIGDVEAIEVEIGKIPGAPPADMASYKVQREAGRDTLKQFQRAMEAAEKASPRPIAPYGAESLKSGGAIWLKVRGGDNKYLAREWMSWGLPGRCLPTAERLEARASLFGQALSYNVKPAEGVEPETVPADGPAVATPDDMADQPDAVDEQVTEPADDAAEATEPEDEMMSEGAADGADDMQAAKPDETITDESAVATTAPSGIEDLLPGDQPEDATADTGDEAAAAVSEETDEEPAAASDDTDEDPAATATEDAPGDLMSTSLRGPL